MQSTEIRETMRLREGNVRTQTLQVLSIEALKKSPRSSVFWIPIVASLTRAATIWAACRHLCISPGEADKSFLLPLTSSTLRAQESISEPKLDVSPLTHKQTHSKRQKRACVCFFGEFTESMWAEIASKHRSLLVFISVRLFQEPLFKSEPGSVHRGNLPLVGKRVTVWSLGSECF